MAASTVDESRLRPPRRPSRNVGWAKAAAEVNKTARKVRVKRDMQKAVWLTILL